MLLLVSTAKSVDIPLQNGALLQRLAVPVTCSVKKNATAIISLAVWRTIIYHLPLRQAIPHLCQSMMRSSRQEAIFALVGYALIYLTIS